MAAVPVVHFRLGDLADILDSPIRVLTSLFAAGKYANHVGA
jgi:hypothetical protein